MLAIWNARPIPRRTISAPASPAMSSPPSRMRPASGANAPVMRLKKRGLAGAVRTDHGASASRRRNRRLTSLDRADAAEGLVQMSRCVSMSAAPARRLRAASAASRTFCAAACALPRRSATNPSSPLRRPSAKHQDDDAQHQAVVLGDTVVTKSFSSSRMHRADQRAEEHVHAAQQDHEHASPETVQYAKSGIGARHEQADEHAADAAETRRRRRTPAADCATTWMPRKPARRGLSRIMRSV